MSVMSVPRKARLAAALPAVACLAAAGLAAAPGARAAGPVPASPVPASPVPARSASAGLHVTGRIDLGRLGPGFSGGPSEAPDGDVYYALGPVVYQVRGDHDPVPVLRASQPVLAVAATSADLLVDTGATVSAYARRDDRLLSTWTLPGSPDPVTVAGLYPVGSTVWADAGPGRDSVSVHVYEFDLSSPAVHPVTVDAYPGTMAADSAGLYGESEGEDYNYVFHIAPSGTSRWSLEPDPDVPIALAAGNVYLLGHDDYDDPDIGNFLDAFDGSTLGHLFAYQVPDSDTGIAGTGIGLLMLGAGTVSLLDPATGRTVATLSVPGAVTLVPGPSAAVVVTVSGSRTHLLRLSR